MPRPPKRGLDYFPLDVDMFSDGKIEDLIAKYSTDGLAIFLALLCIVYRHGYYFEAESEDAIVRAIIKELYDDRISRQRVKDVLHFCGAIRLLDSRLLCENVVTSTAIQSRYDEVTVRNKADKSKYWLLPEKGGALSNAPENEVSATETTVSATDIRVSVSDIPTNKSKENKNKSNENEITTTTPPDTMEVYRYFKEEYGKDIAVDEAFKFHAYNEARGWDCMPRWREAAKLWMARAD